MAGVSTAIASTGSGAANRLSDYGFQTLPGVTRFLFADGLATSRIAKARVIAGLAGIGLNAGTQVILGSR